MTGSIVARRYARALFSLGKKTGLPELEQYAASLGDMRSALAASPDLVKVFRNPVFTADEKKRLVAQLAAKLKFGDVIRNFCLLLAEKNRLAELDRIADSFDELLDAEKGVVRGELLTAVKLNAARQSEVLKQLAEKTNRTLVLSFGVSPEILGGVVLRVGDQVMDASLRAQLSILKDTIKRGE